MTIRTGTENATPMHTPGPWRYEPTRDNSATTRQMIDEPIGGSIMADDTYIARIWSDADNPWENACLMAAAPDLLAALEKAALVINGMYTKKLPECYAPTTEFINEINAALARAKGALK